MIEFPIFVEDLSEDDMSDEEGGGEGQTYKSKERGGGNNRAKGTVVDDQFFKLSEMSKFLDLEDQRETKRRQQQAKDARKG